MARCERKGRETYDRDDLAALLRILGGAKLTMLNKSWMDLETAEEEDMYFINMVTTGQEGDDLDKDAVSLEREHEA
jgi:hypothetical protein